MTLPVDLNIEIIKGDSLSIPLTFVDPEDDSLTVDVSSYQLYFTMILNRYQDETEAVVTRDIVLPAESSNGMYILVIEPDDTVSLLTTSYDFDIQIATPDRTSVITLVQGKIKLVQGVTQRV